MSPQTDLIELGLVKECNHVVISNYRGEVFKDFCGAETIRIGGMCSRHDNSAELIKQEKIEREKTVLAQRRIIEDELFPKLTKRIMEIVDNEDARNADVIKIWMTTMDRIGLAAVQGLMIEGTMHIDAPVDILRAMLRPVTDEPVLDAEVVELEPGGA